MVVIMIPPNLFLRTPAMISASVMVSGFMKPGSLHAYLLVAIFRRRLPPKTSSLPDGHLKSDVSREVVRIYRNYAGIQDPINTESVIEHSIISDDCSDRFTFRRSSRGI